MSWQRITEPIGRNEFEVGWELGFLSVRLPHQCDQWVAAEGRTPEKCIAELETFIAEAQEALKVLKEIPRD